MLNDVGVHPWPESWSPTEQDLRHILHEEGLKAYRWSNGPGDIYSSHSHKFDKILYVVRGKITFGLPATGERITLKVGDRLELPAGIIHDAVVGSQGVVCLEAHLLSTM